MERIRQWLGRGCGQHHGHFPHQQDHVSSDGAWLFHDRGLEAAQKGGGLELVSGYLTTLAAKKL